MDIDQWAALAARGHSRRAALRAGGAGLAAALIAGAAAAQEGAPEADDGPAQYLFVQSFGAGTLAPAEGESGSLTLTLSGGIARTLFFADRPRREAGIVPTADFLAALTETRDDPPNAALVAARADGTEDDAEAIWVVTLLGAAFEAEAQTLTYDLRVILPAEVDSTIFAVTPAAVPTAPLALDAGHLFIDGFGKAIPVERGFIH